MAHLQQSAGEEFARYVFKTQAVEAGITENAVATNRGRHILT